MKRCCNPSGKGWYTENHGRKFVVYRYLLSPFNLWKIFFIFPFFNLAASHNYITTMTHQISNTIHTKSFHRPHNQTTIFDMSWHEVNETFILFSFICWQNIGLEFSFLNCILPLKWGAQKWPPHDCQYPSSIFVIIKSFSMIPRKMFANKTEIDKMGLSCAKLSTA